VKNRDEFGVPGKASTSSRRTVSTLVLAVVRLEQRGKRLVELIHHALDLRPGKLQRVAENAHAEVSLVR